MARWRIPKKGAEGESGKYRESLRQKDSVNINKKYYVFLGYLCLRIQKVFLSLLFYFGREHCNKTHLGG